MGETEGSVEAIIDALVSARATVATAESLTGGLVAAALTSVPGASAAVRGGVIAYATDLKASLSDVPTELLERDGPVSVSTAAAMAIGVRSRCAASYGVATTGVAGPDPQDGHSPGTVHVAVAGPDGTRTVTLRELGGDRQAVREAAVRQALELLCRVIRGGGESLPTPRR